MKLATASCVVCFVLGCAAETDANRPVQDAELPKLLAQRVTGTVKREAATLVRLETEREAVVTTPEHPFATPGSGWISAGQLAPGDRVVSARFGVVRVLSVQSETPPRPVAVFNLSVDRSHAYLVGTDQVLVHNRKCNDPAERSKGIEEAERELRELEQQALPTSAEDQARHIQQIADLKSQIVKLKVQAQNARQYQKRKSLAAAGPNRKPRQKAAPVRDRPEEYALTRHTRAVEALDREISTLKHKAPMSPQEAAEIQQRLAELGGERRMLDTRVRSLRVQDKRRRGVAVETTRERLRKRAEADYEAATKELEAAQRELSELVGGQPSSDAEGKHRAERKAALESNVKSLRLEYESSKRILDWEREIAKRGERTPSTKTEREKIELEQRALRAKIAGERRKQTARAYFRRQRADRETAGPETREKRLLAARQARERRLRTDAYLADTERPRDTLELLEEELAAHRQRADSGSHDERTEYLTERIAALNALVALRRKNDHIRGALSNLRARRGELIRNGQDTQEIDGKIARLEQERTTNRIRCVQLRVRDAVLEMVDGPTWTDAPQEIDEARLHELERELAEGLPDERRLTEMEHEIAESDTLDEEFFEEIWREAGNDTAAARQAVQDEAEDVDVELLALAESVRTSPSPERAAALTASLEALQNELRDERRAVEAADVDLANQHAFLSQTLAPSGSSRRAAGRERLAEVRRQRLELRTQWRERMQLRLDRARRDLEAMQSIKSLRDEALEADMARQIALLEHEVQHPAF